MLREQKRRKKGMRAKKTGRRERKRERRREEREIEREGNFSILLGYPAPFSEPRKEGDLQFRGKNTSGYLRDKVPRRTKRLRASRIPPHPLHYPRTILRGIHISQEKTGGSERKGERRRGGGKKEGDPYEIAEAVSSTELKYISGQDITRLTRRADCFPSTDNFVP